MHFIRSIPLKTFHRKIAILSKTTLHELTIADIIQPQMSRRSKPSNLSFVVVIAIHHAKGRSAWGEYQFPDTISFMTAIRRPQRELLTGQ